MSPAILRCVALGVVEKLVADLRDRRGFRQLWDGLDDDVRDEIVEDWARLVSVSFETARRVEDAADGS